MLINGIEVNIVEFLKQYGGDKNKASSAIAELTGADFKEVQAAVDSVCNNNIICFNCGSEIARGAGFCTKCGKPVCNTKAEIQDDNTTSSQPDEESKWSDFFWDSPIMNNRLVNYITLHFGYLICGIIEFPVAISFLQEEGFWSKVIGIVFLINACICVFLNIKSFLLRTRKEYSAKEFREKKSQVFSHIIGALIFTIILNVTGGGIYQSVKDIVFEGDEKSVEEILDENLKGAKWSMDKIEEGYAKVYVEGYLTLFHEETKIEFLYEESGDSYQVRLLRIDFPESEESYTGLDMIMIWEMLESYNTN